MPPFPSFRFALCLGAGLVSGLALPPASVAQEDAIDFRYAPAYWYSAIGLPGDHHKPLVDDRGALLYDFGPGPYVSPNTVVALEPAEGTSVRISQTYPDARVPLLRTVLESANNRAVVRTYSLVPGDLGAPPSPVTETVERSGGLTGSIAWADPPEGTDPAFRHVAWGTNRPITYRLPVEAGSARTVVLGFCESYRTRPGQRLLELDVEGAPRRTFDPLDGFPVNTPRVVVFDAHDTDRDGLLDVEIRSPQGDPNTLVNVLWVFPAGFLPDAAALIRGDLSAQADVYLDAGREPQVRHRPSRFDVLDASFSAGSSPRLRIRSRRHLRYDPATGIVFAEDVPFVRTSPSPVEVRASSAGLDLFFAPGTSRVRALVHDGFVNDTSVFPNWTAAEDTLGLAAYWLREAGIPYGRIAVPDARLQAMLDASIRTVYQMSERVDGALQFQPGAALYRGLWIHDGVYFTELSLQLGDRNTAREVLDGMLRYQHPSGQVEVMRPANIHRETPLLLWMLCRYAELTGDDAWLRARWHHVENGIAWIRHLRELTLHPGAPNYGLTPAGFADGGMHGVQPEYASVNWILIALPRLVAAAARLGYLEAAEDWQRLYTAFLASFRRAAARDVRRDPLGHPYLPVRVGAAPIDDVPTRAQWTLPEALMHGSYLAPDDSLVAGTLGMLEAHRRQGLVTDVGWLQDGIWGYFGGFFAEAYLMRGQGRAAAVLLYAMANHASPVSTWPEEQMPVGQGERTAGDFPHAWAAATMPRLVLRLLALEAEDTLVLFRGLPSGWLAPGAEVTLDDVATRFGRIRLSLQVSSDGRKASITYIPLSTGRAGYVSLDPRAFEADGFTVPDAHYPAGAPLELVLQRD